jgi:hypothetical protein
LQFRINHKFKSLFLIWACHFEHLHFCDSFFNLLELGCEFDPCTLSLETNEIQMSYILCLSIESSLNFTKCICYCLPQGHNPSMNGPIREQQFSTIVRLKKKHSHMFQCNLYTESFLKILMFLSIVFFTRHNLLWFISLSLPPCGN